MGRPRHFEVYFCPYCNIAGWRRKGEIVAHVKKSHGKKVKAEDCRRPTRK
jgi:uncharacterized C2H2 Zn-finger protein